MVQQSQTEEWSSCLPVVMTRGRRCFLQLRAGPVWRADGSLMALELLSVIRDRQTGEPVRPDLFFSQTPAAEQLRILSWQLDMLQWYNPWCLTRGLRVSINITRSQAISLLTSPAVAAKVADLSDVLRLELSEYFISPLSGGESDPLVQAMAVLAPLWLDDFGCGTTPYACLTDGRFEAVKVDRCFVERLHRMAGGTEFLRGLNLLVAGTGMQIIAEGIADRALWQFVSETGVSACQGWLWPETCVTRLEQLPVRLPSGAKEGGHDA